MTKPSVVYLAGPMRGYPHFNFPAFDKYRDKLADAGYHVISPADLDRENGVDPEKTYTADELQSLLPAAMHRDIEAIITKCDGLAVIPGWEGSSGANLEVSLARWLSMPVIDAETLREIPSGDARFHRVLNEMRALHDRKQADYGRDHDPFANVRGSAEWNVEPWIAAMVRAHDKIRRLQKAARGGQLFNETVEDSFMDLAVYAIIALILYRETVETVDV